MPEPADTTRSPRPIDRVLTPFQEFTRSEAAGGIVLLLATIVALVWANSPWGDTYQQLWHQPLDVHVAGHGMEKSLSHWISDGLMVIFFFLVGLEIKREVLVGELASRRQALLPIAAAFGGALTPAALYAALTWGTEAVRGWGVPMATDIAFALGILALLGSRAPAGLRIFLTALAIVDDIIAVLVIAIFYTANLSWPALLAAAVILLLLVVANRARVSSLPVYLLLGVGLWFAVLQSGIHATIAGILLAMTIPARARIAPREFVRRSRSSLDAFERADGPDGGIAMNHAHRVARNRLEAAARAVQSPMQRLEHALNPWVAYGIVPLFALANAGVALGGNAGGALGSRAGLGILLGLIVGKQVGITLATWLVVRSGRTSLPAGVGWRHIYGAGWLGGVGFTMALFIADLAFLDADRLAAAKLAILLASLVAGAVAFVFLRRLPPVPDEIG